MQEGTSNLKQWMQPNGKVKVLSTIAMINDLVVQVGGEHVDSLSLVIGELDPHTYQLVKGDDEKLAAADLIFYNGLELEHGPSLRTYLAESKKAVGLGDLIQKKNPELILHYNEALDPHIWMAIDMWVRTVEPIVEALAAFDPVHAEQYRKNGEQLILRMEEKHRELKVKIGKVSEENRFLITSHDAFNYFARSYLATDEEVKNNIWQKRFMAPEGLAPESQISTTDIRNTLDHMKKYGVHVIFPESNISQASIRKLVDAGREQGMELQIASDYLYGDAMGAKGSDGDTYLKMVEHNVETIVKYLHNYPNNRTAHNNDGSE